MLTGRRPDQRTHPGALCVVANIETRRDENCENYYLLLASRFCRIPINSRSSQRCQSSELALLRTRNCHNGHYDNHQGATTTTSSDTITSCALSSSSSSHCTSLPICPVKVPFRAIPYNRVKPAKGPDLFGVAFDCLPCPVSPEQPSTSIITTLRTADRSSPLHNLHYTLTPTSR